MTVQIKLLHFFKLAILMFIIALLQNRLYAADKEYIEVKIDGETVGKWMKLVSVDEYDSAGNKVHSKTTYGEYDYYEWHYEYNSKGEQIREIYTKGSQKTAQSHSNETLHTYDKKGNKIYSKNSDGKEIFYEYNSKGKLIHSKTSDDKEYWYEYDSNGNEIHSEDSDGNEEWSEYNAKGKIVHYKSSNGYEYWNDYDSKGNNLHTKYADGNEEWYEYNDKGKIIHWKKSNGFEYRYVYDTNGNKVYTKHSDGVEEWNEYDKYGNEISTIVKNSGKLEKGWVHILEYYKNSETLKKDSCYFFSR